MKNILTWIVALFVDVEVIEVVFGVIENPWIPDELVIGVGTDVVVVDDEIGVNTEIEGNVEAVETVVLVNEVVVMGAESRFAIEVFDEELVVGVKDNVFDGFNKVLERFAGVVPGLNDPNEWMVFKKKKEK